MRSCVATLPTVIVREGGRSSIPETLVIETRSRGVLDPPHVRGMTTLVSLRGATRPPELNERPRRPKLAERRRKVEATKQSILSLRCEMDCFAEPVIGRAFARPVARNDVESELAV